MDARREVLVVGGGIGGLATALALREAGFEPAVFEARPEAPDPGGLFLTLAVNGLRVLEQLGVLEPLLRGRVIPTPRIVFESSSGKELGRSTNGRLPDGTPALTLMREELRRALAVAAARRGIRVHHGARLRSLVSAGDRVQAVFDDGARAEGALMVGADGIHSTVRTFVDPGAPAPSWTGLLNLGGVCPGAPLPSTPGEMRMLWGRRAFLGYTVTPGGEGWWFANVARRDEPRRGDLSGVTAEEWRKQLLGLFAGDPPGVQALLRATPEIHAYPIHDLQRQPHWRSGRMVLVGDAAHAVAPSTGQGASLALEDAAMLAHCLSVIPEVEGALDRFVALRRPRAERMMAEGRRRGAYKAPSSEWARRARDLLVPAALRLFASDRKLAWIHDYRVPLARVPIGGAAR